MEVVKTCELCLELIVKTEDFENLYCDEKQNLQILQNLEITVSKDAKICSNCVNISRLIYNFKTSCLTNNDHLKTLLHHGINDKLILEEVMVEKSKSEFKNEKVCRFCLNFSEVNSLVEVNLQQDVVLKDMLERCLPEIDMKFVQNPLMCYICNRLLKKLYNFISQCEDTEVFRNLDPKTDVLVNENTSPTVENNDKNINESFAKEENYDGIESPELEIKSEDFDINEDFKDSIKESNCLLKKSEVQAEPSSFPSENQSSLVIHKKNHEKSYGNCEEEEIQLYKCNICSFTASNKCEIVKHKKKGHKDKKQGLRNPVAEKDVTPKPRGTIKEKKFVCDICSYQTTTESSVKRHYLIHKEPLEVNLFKCDYCFFATKWKESLARHAICHKNTSNFPKFKCNDCPYETNIRRNLVGHVQVHKSHSQVNTYKCKVCPFQTKNKRYILVHEERHQAVIYICDECNYTSKLKTTFLRHLRDHKEGKQPAKSNQSLEKVKQHNPVEEKDVKPKPHGTTKDKKFVCDNCSYRTNRNDLFKHHYIMHKESSEVNLFKCDHCSFVTKWKGCLVRHAICHKNTSEIPKFICNDCQYETSRKQNLVRHVQVHKNHSQVNMYNGKVCSYQTKSRHCLQVHQEMHQVEIYTCDECNYTTKLKNWFLRHLRHHKEGMQLAKSNWNIEKVKQHNPDEETDVKHKPRGTTKDKKFVCDSCPYRTNRNANLKLHYLTHKEKHEIYTCDECNYKSKFKQCVTRHLQYHKKSKQPARSSQNLKEVRQHNPVEEKVVKPKPRGSIKEKKFVCDICSYQTNRNHHFKQHYLVHKKPSEVNLFKCDYCPFATKWKGCQARHAVLHQNPSKLPKFNCNDCQYKTNIKGNLVRHVQLHKNHSEVNMYKCKVCPFQTKHKISIQLHEERHQAVIYTCDECNYTTKLKTWFLRHLRHHKEEKQPPKSSQNLK